jgi:hypothetical protein
MRSRSFHPFGLLRTLGTYGALKKTEEEGRHDTRKMTIRLTVLIRFMVREGTMVA